MSEKEQTNNNEEPNKAFKPETKLNKAINSIIKGSLIIVLLLSIAGLLSVSIISFHIIIVTSGGWFTGETLITNIILASGFLVFSYNYYKYVSKKIHSYKVDRILLHAIIYLNTVISVTMMIGIVCGYSTMINCYKPAIYLYPKKMTEVSITLDPSIKVDIDIPRYAENKGWKVMAYPDGKLVDLQPEYTNCSELETHIFGLEYAKEACELNNYPYIFWEGKQTTKLLPAKKEGWLVKKENTKRFLEDKLNLVGFNNTEKKEFLAYWVPRILELKQEKVFIYFAQNKEIDEYLPMNISPQPDAVNRFYIIVDARMNNYTNTSTQQLIPFRRQGFSVVDWGGCLIK